MITVTVKLYGALPERIADYDSKTGIVVRLDQGARVKELNNHLGLKPDDAGVVAIDGRVAGPDDPLSDGATIKIFQKAYGG